MLRPDKRNWNLFGIYCIKKIVQYYRSNLEKLCSNDFPEKASHYHEIIRLFFSFSEIYPQAGLAKTKITIWRKI